MVVTRTELPQTLQGSILVVFAALTRQDVLYLLAHLPKRNDFITLALHRVRSMRVTAVQPKNVSHLDVDRYVRSLFGVDGSGSEVTYRLRFDVTVAPYIRERIWHPSQHLRRRKDGGVDLSFTYCESVEVSAWVASWRDNVAVLSPTSLREELRELGQHLVELYR